ncbi:MAG TPA: VOC family protein [Rubrobacter sp.]|nr:VOC family protein [Rubrobacter sp.]
MPTRLDHLVILVRDLEEAVRDYGRLGFRVTPGGEHADGLTRNALVPFRDGTYLELVAFVDPEDGRDNVWGWRGFMPREGLVDYCATSDGLLEEIGRLRRLGLRVEDLGEGGRRLPDGGEIRWRSASIAQEGRVMPFLIEDVTPRRMRVPGGTAADHPNGATGIKRLEISAPDPARARRDLAALTDAPPETPTETLKLGACELLPAKRDGEHRAGPTAVGLSTNASKNVGELDRGLAHGARLTFTPEVVS